MTAAFLLKFARHRDRYREIQREAWWTEVVGVGGIAFVGGLEAVLAKENRRRVMDREQEGANHWVLR